MGAGRIDLMGLLSGLAKLLSGKTDEGGLLDGAGNLAKDIRDSVTGEEHKGKLAELVVEISKAQAAINQAEAASKHLFVAGWRPFIGWTCGTAIALEYIIGPLLRAFTKVDFPHIDMGVIQSVVLGMLGLGLSVGRTFEKLAGVSGKHK
jgi:hypothetical protein